MTDILPRMVSARRTGCPVCRATVVEAPLAIGGLTIYLEPEEFVLYFRCPTCLSDRLRDHSRKCWRCDDKKFVGELPSETGGFVDVQTGERRSTFAAALDDDGRAIPLDLSRLAYREKRYGPNAGSLEFVDTAIGGLAIHRAHACRELPRLPQAVRAAA